MVFVPGDYWGFNSWPAVTWIILRLPVHILIGSKKCILHTDLIYIRSNHIRKLAHSHKVNVEIAAYLNPIVNRSKSLSDLIAVSVGDAKIITSRWPLKDRQEVFVLRVKLKSYLSLEILNLHPRLSGEKARGSKYSTKLTFFDYQLLPWLQKKGSIGRNQSRL